MTLFVACPYQLFPLDDYKKTYEQVGKAYGVTFQFADEQFTSKHVLDKVADYIRLADVSLFDITGWNPNVALELGIAVGLNRRYFILLNTKIETKDAPSDIKGIDRLQYSSLSELEAKLSLLVKQLLPTSIPSESAFDVLRQRITDYLADNPSQRAADIAAALGEETFLLRSALQTMTNAGILVTTGATKGTRYSVRGGRVTQRRAHGAV
jgi:hypothetical protein